MSFWRICVLTGVVWLHILRNTAAFVHMGCFLKQDMESKYETDLYGTASHEICIEKCKQKGYPFAGISDGHKCSCYESILPDIYTPMNTTFVCYDERATKCEGNRLQYCGTKDVNIVFMVCPFGKYGTSCASDCSCSGRACKFDGSCVNECWLGTGAIGKTDCPACIAGKFGPHCTLTCPDNCHNNCDPQTARCAQPCSSGHGEFCQDWCPKGKFGHNCESYCHANCHNNQCEPVAGKCEGGCKNNTLKGVYCQQACSSDCVDSECDPHTGDCTLGCKEGLFGEKCRNTCPNSCTGPCEQYSGNCTSGCVDGKWGYHCNKACSEFCVPLKCDQYNASCSDGCQDDRRYGQQCENRCSMYCDGYNCSSVTGNCLIGCTEERIGDKCDQICPLECEVCDEDCLYDYDTSGSTGMVMKEWGIYFLGVTIASVVLYNT